MPRKKTTNRKDSEGLIGYLKDNPIIIAALILVLGFFLFKFIQYYGCSSSSHIPIGRCMLIDISK